MLHCSVDDMFGSATPDVNLSMDTLTLSPTSIESHIENEKKQIASINAGYNKKRNEMYGNPELKAAAAFFDEQARSSQSLFERLDNTDERFQRARIAINKEIRKNALRTFPRLMDLAKLNAASSRELRHALHPGHHVHTHDIGLLADAEVVIGDHDYDVFKPPYPLQHAEINVGGNFAQDDSFPWADWGTLGNYVQFRHNHSWTDISGGSSKYGYNVVQLGINYKMPSHGALAVTVLLKAFDHQVDFQMNDNFGPSDAVLDVSHMIFVPVKSAAGTIYLHATTLLDQRKTSDGDNVSGSLSTVALNTPLILNFTTDHIHEGENLEISVASWFRISSSVTCMKTAMSVASLLKVEKIYLRVVE
jgi:HKD family nuclease